MKRLSPLFLVIALIWTWNIVHGESTPSFSTHVNIQNELREIIQGSITKKYPEARQINIYQLWTEAEKQNLIRASLAYRFEAPDEAGQWTQIDIEASALLKKDEATVEDVWTLKQLQANHSSLAFAEGLRIIAGQNAEDSTTNAEPQTESQPQAEPAAEESH